MRVFHNNYLRGYSEATPKTKAEQHYRSNLKSFSLVMLSKLDPSAIKFVESRPDSVLLVNQSYSGVLSPKTDTVSIRIITTSSLVLANRNPAGDYGKFTFKK